MEPYQTVLATLGVVIVLKLLILFVAGVLLAEVVSAADAGQIHIDAPVGIEAHRTTVESVAPFKMTTLHFHVMV